MFIFLRGANFQVFGTGITPLLRNQNKAWIAMVLMVTNFVIDTTLSGVFVMFLKFGASGAALATLVGQCVALVPAMLIILKKENRISLFSYKLRKETIAYILKVGAPITGLSFIPSLTMIVINRQVNHIRRNFCYCSICGRFLYYFNRSTPFARCRRRKSALN
nr:polysaccharide biosynthesis C-terminal domain-containing protein [uncultured Clostridium sp.]